MPSLFNYNTLKVTLNRETNWVLSSNPIADDNLTNSGFIDSIYQKDQQECIYNKYLVKISKQSPVARIQSKRSFLESILADLDKSIEFEHQFAIAGMVTKDWQKYIHATENDTVMQFASTVELARNLKKEARL